MEIARHNPRAPSRYAFRRWLPFPTLGQRLPNVPHNGAGDSRFLRGH